MKLNYEKRQLKLSGHKTFGMSNSFTFPLTMQSNLLYNSYHKHIRWNMSFSKLLPAVNVMDIHTYRMTDIRFFKVNGTQQHT